LFDVVSVGAIRAVVRFSGIFFCAVAINDCVDERAQNRLGVVPTDRFQSAKAVGDINLLVADFAEVTGAVAGEDFKDFIRAGGADQTDDGGVRGRFVPIIERFDERRAGFVAGRNRFFFDWAEGPVTFPDVGGLRAFELIDGPENGQPAIRIGRGEAGEMRGINDEDGVKFEADWSRLDVADSGEQESGKDFAIRKTATNFGREFLKNAFARGFLEKADERLDFGMQSDGFGIKFSFVGTNGTEAREESEITQARDSTGGESEESSAFHMAGGTLI
jgi:hypothetical protein